LPRVAKTARAEQDLEDIWFYVAMDDPVAADGVLNAIDAQCRLLATQPQMGRARPELAPEVRSFPVGRYVLFYLPQSKGIKLVRVLHGSRDVEAHFRENQDTPH
jgi:toxin ParE1/3/4